MRLLFTNDVKNWTNLYELFVESMCNAVFNNKSSLLILKKVLAYNIKLLLTVSFLNLQVEKIQVKISKTAAISVKAYTVFLRITVVCYMYI
jgi:hypothetical protein